MTWALPLLTRLDCLESKSKTYYSVLVAAKTSGRGCPSAQSHLPTRRYGAKRYEAMFRCFSLLDWAQDCMRYGILGVAPVVRKFFFCQGLKFITHGNNCPSATFSYI
jgi:hypothetical protein